MLKDENYYTVFGWMINRLHLRGNDLKVYALIYSFSQDGESEYKGNINFITEFTGTSDATVKRSLERLEELGYIEKTKRHAGTGGSNTYRAITLEEVFAVGVTAQNELTPQLKMSCSSAQNELTPQLKMSCPLNKVDILLFNNKNNNKKVSKKEIKKERESYDEIFEAMEVSPRLKSAVIDFIRHLKTSYQIVVINSRLESMLSKLDLKYQTDDLAKCKEVRRAITNGYKRLECEEVV